MIQVLRAALALAFILPALLAQVGIASAAPGSNDPNAARQLAAVRQATNQYHHVSIALADGYLATDDCEALPGVGGMGYHYMNPDRMGKLDILHPDILLYAPSAHGPQLAGVEYFSPAMYRHPDGTVSPWLDRFNDPPADWVVLPGPSLFGQPFDGPMAGHVDGMPWHYDLHVWLWQANPDGVFAQWNPNVHC